MAKNYLVVGEDEYLVAARIKELIAEAGGDDWSLERLGSWEQARERLLNLPMFAGPRIFTVDFTALAAANPDPSQVAELLAGQTNVLIIYARKKPDKSSRLYKAISKQAQLIELSAPKGYQLLNWLTRRAGELGAKIDRRGAETLAYLVGNNLLALENELAKLTAYNPEISEETVRKLVVASVQANIFELVDSVTAGQGAKAQILGEEMLRSGAEAPYILYMLGRQYRLLFRFLFYRQAGHSSQQIQKLLPAMHPYAFEKLSGQARRLDLAACGTALHTILAADYSFKTGRYNGLTTVQMALAKLTKK